MSREVTIERLEDTYGVDNFKEIVYEDKSAFFRRPRLRFMDEIKDIASLEAKPFSFMEKLVDECFLEGDKAFKHNAGVKAYAFQELEDYLKDFEKKTVKAKKPSPAGRSRKTAGTSSS
ncbi:hypothetical protein ElyMa_002565000 [Elysia marginata]|uniref:Uncharacterized protein n=1 Tax=Elysia marginata TaxID=1093978 RepID=A0AAV4H0F4_9GAST|nr:hypothetical protein ElyMa_002565000 [Elysia marginata]